jgi:hypothetical protein
MTELTDQEIEEILKCLDRHNFSYVIPRNQIAKILKNNINKDNINKHIFDNINNNESLNNTNGLLDNTNGLLDNTNGLLDNTNRLLDNTNEILENNIIENNDINKTINNIDDKLDNTLVKIINKLHNIKDIENEIHSLSSETNYIDKNKNINLDKKTINDIKLDELIEESNNNLMNEINKIRDKFDIKENIQNNNDKNMPFKSSLNSVRDRLNNFSNKFNNKLNNNQENYLDRLNKIRNTYDNYLETRPPSFYKSSRISKPGPINFSPHVVPQTPPFINHYDNRFINVEPPPSHLPPNPSHYRTQLYGSMLNRPPPNPSHYRTPYNTPNEKDIPGEIIIEKHIIDANSIINSEDFEGIKQEIIMIPEDRLDAKLTFKDMFSKLKDLKKNIFKYDKEETVYYDSLSSEKKIKIDKLETKISKLNNIKIPLRFRVLRSNLPLHNKAMIINKLEDLCSNKLLGGTEITKYSNWINSLLKIPFKNYKKLPIDSKSEDKNIGNYLIDVKKTLDSAVYGHLKSKEQVIQIIAQWITNPVSIGNCIGIQGVMGNGKTTLVKDGIAKAIGRPFAFITLGGCSDSSFLEGHNYTYEGSMWGKIVDILISCKCMNPVFYFDELDKVSETPKGEEIINTLIHLTDASQNTQFNDKYFSGVDLDLSKSLFIFSFNDKKKINPILLDRLICIETDDFKLEDKIQIAKNYLLKDIFNQLTIKKDTYNLTDELIEYIIEKYTNKEGGVRTLKKHLFGIFSKLNLLKLTKNDDTIKYSFDLDKNLLEKNEINKEIIDLLIGSDNSEKDEYYKTFYM